MFLFIRRLLYNFTVNQDKLMLGRWRIDYCDKILSRKIQLSNEDNCGAK
jgi:hypothetical protein